MRQQRWDAQRGEESDSNRKAKHTELHSKRVNVKDPGST